MRPHRRTCTYLCAALFATGCTPRPSDAECEAFADHMIELAARAATELSSEKEADGDAPGPAEDAAVRQRGEAQRTDLVARCRRSPRSALECAMAARDLKSLGSCRQ